MMVEDQFDGGVLGIGVIKPLEEANEFARPMAILDASMHLAGEQVDPGEQAQALQQGYNGPGTTTLHSPVSCGDAAT